MKGKVEATDEWLIKSIVKDPSSVPDSVWHKIFRAIRQFLRKNGINVHFTPGEIKAMVVEAVTKGAPGAGTGIVGTRKQSRTYADPFFSQLIKVVADNVKQMPTKVQSITKWLQKQQVKPAELKWMGVEQWMKDNQTNGKIDRQAFLDFLKANDIEVREVVKGEDVGALRAEHERLLKESEKEPYTFDLARLEAVESRLAKADRGITDTKYANHQLPGGENYKEMLFVLPVKRGHKDYFSSHWDEPNVLAHVRWNERTDTKGNRVLFVEEVQSDVGQDYKEQLINVEKSITNDFKAIVKNMVRMGVLKEVC